MSWFTDTQLFIWSSEQFYVSRVKKEFGSSPIGSYDVNIERETLSFSKHLSLVNNKESDFDGFKASFPNSGTGYLKFINNQGLVITWDLAKQAGTWSREEPNSLFWSLAGITKQKSVAEQALEEKVSDLEAKISFLEEENKKIKTEKDVLETKNAKLQSEVNKENGLKGDDIVAGLAALEVQVSNLTSKLAGGCGLGGDVSPLEEPWITGQTVPSNWVLFGELDVLPLSKNPTLTITKATGGGLELGDDKTTNVQAKCFYRGIYPIVVVDVAELTPNREEARFDSNVWGLYENAGIFYAARKPFASEMSVDAHKTC